MRVSVALVLAAACGRLDFAPRAPGQDAGPDSSLDAAPGSNEACPIPATAPDPFTINGQVIVYTSFQSYVGFVGATVTAFDATTGELIGSAQSAGSGHGSSSDPMAGLYSISVSGGIPRRLRLEITDPTVDTTEQYTDVLGSDLDGYLSTVWGWTSLQVVYGAVGLSLPTDPGSDPYGSVNIMIETCAGSGIGSAIVTIDPDPALNRLELDVNGSDVIEYGAVTYLDANNNPQDQPGTIAANPSAVSFLNSPGSNHITVSAPGLEFPPYDLDVHAGPYSSVIVMHPYP